MTTGSNRWRAEQFATTGMIGSDVDGNMSVSGFTIGSAAILMLKWDQAAAPNSVHADWTNAYITGGFGIWYTKYATQTSYNFGWATTGNTSFYHQVFHPASTLPAANIAVEIGTVAADTDTDITIPGVTPNDDASTVIAFVAKQTSLAERTPNSMTSGWSHARGGSSTGMQAGLYSAAKYFATPAASGDMTYGFANSGLMVGFMFVLSVVDTAPLPALKPNGYVTGTGHFAPANDGAFEMRQSTSADHGSWFTIWNGYTGADVAGFLAETITTTKASGGRGLGLVPLSPNAAHTIELSLGSVPADFASMHSIGFRCSTSWHGTNTDDTISIDVVIYPTFFATPYASATLMTRTGLGASEKASYDHAVPAILTSAGQNATKADWDAARVVITLTDSRSMGADSGTPILVDLEVVGTYTTSGPSEQSVVVPTAMFAASAVAPTIAPSSAGGFTIPTGSNTTTGQAVAVAGSGAAPAIIIPEVVAVNGGVVVVITADEPDQFIDIPVASAVSSALAPTLAGTGAVSVAVATVAAASTAAVPSVAATGAGSISVPTATGSTLATGPTVAASGAGALVISSASAAHAGVVPTLAASGSVNLTVTTATGDTEAVVLAVASAGSAPISIPTATGATTGLTPQVAGVGEISLAVSVAQGSFTAQPVSLGGGASEITIVTAELAISTVVPTLAGSSPAALTVPVAAPVASGATLSVGGSGALAISVTTASTTLVGVAPALAGSGVQAVAVPVADGSLTALSVSLSVGASSIAVPTASVTASALALTLSAGVVQLPIPTATLAAAGLTPTLNVSGSGVVPIPVAVHETEAIFVALTVAGGPQFITVNAAIVAISSSTVAVAGAGVSSLAIPVAARSLSGAAPLVSGVGTIQITVTVAQASAQGAAFAVTPGGVAVALPAATVSVLATTLTLTTGASGLTIPTAVLAAAARPLALVAGGVGSLVVPIAALTLIGQTLGVLTGAISPVFTGQRDISADVARRVITADLTEQRTIDAMDQSRSIREG